MMSCRKAPPEFRFASSTLRNFVPSGAAHEAAAGHALSEPPDNYTAAFSNSYFISGYDVGVQEGNIRKTMAARGLVNGRGPLRRSGRDLVFRCYPPERLSPKKKKQKLTFWVSLCLSDSVPLRGSAGISCLQLLRNTCHMQPDTSHPRHGNGSMRS